MGWVKLDDQFADHPKVEKITDKALRLYIRALCYATRHRTDGLILRQVATRLGSLKSVGELTAVGLWEEDKGGYRIHDYLAYNPSREQLLKLSQERANAGSKGGATAQANARATAPMGYGYGLGKPRYESPIEKAIREGRERGA